MRLSTQDQTERFTMPILKTLDATSYNADTFLDADVVRVGEAYLRLSTFVQGSALLDVFQCDSGTYSAIRRASCKVLALPYDKTTPVRWSRKPGTKVWKRLAKDKTAPSNHETKTTKVKSYSGDAVRKGIASLRSTKGIAIRVDSERKTVDGTTTYVVALVRTAS
jgi:hypothetical protein